MPTPLSEYQLIHNIFLIGWTFSNVKYLHFLEIGTSSRTDIPFMIVKSLSYSLAQIMNIAAGAAGFLSLTIQLTQILTDYINTAKSADQDAKDILKEAECLKDILEQFVGFVEAKKFQGNIRASSALRRIINVTESNLRGLLEKLPKFQGSKSEQLSKRLIWPFKKPDCIEIVGTLQRCIQIINFSMNTQSLLVIHFPQIFIYISHDRCLICTSKLLLETSAEVKAALEQQMVKLDSFELLPAQVVNMRSSLSEISESISSFFPDFNTYMRTVEFGIQDLQLSAKSRAILYSAFFLRFCLFTEGNAF